MTTMAEGRRSFPTRSSRRFQDFDPRREFKTVRVVKLGSVVFLPGQPFDKKQVSERLLRQIYENRQIIMIGDPLPDTINPAMQRRARIVHAMPHEERVQAVIKRAKRSIPRVARELGGP